MMKTPTKPGLDFVYDLIHRCPSAALATHSVAAPGFPFATSVAIAPMRDHRPWMLISRLAEHRINLEADPRASLHLIDPQAQEPMSAARTTLVGSAVRVEPSAQERARFLRYQPTMEPLLGLGDFAFFALDWTSSRAIGGFGRMGWVEADAAPAAMTAEQEDALQAELAPLLDAQTQWLGCDAQGVDLLTANGRARLVLPINATKDQWRTALRSATLR